MQGGFELLTTNDKDQARVSKYTKSTQKPTKKALMQLTEKNILYYMIITK